MLAEALEHLRDDNITIKAEEEFTRHYLLTEYS